MTRRWGIDRPMLVDSLEGDVHRAYGTLPNMTYIMAAGGNIIYRAAWTDERTIRMALDQVLHERKARRDGTRLTPYFLEWLPQRVNIRESFVDGLVQIGDRAVDEFIAAVEHTEGTAAADLLRRWRDQVGATADD